MFLSHLLTCLYISVIIFSYNYEDYTSPSDGIYGCRSSFSPGNYGYQYVSNYHGYEFQ